MSPNCFLVLRPSTNDTARVTSAHVSSYCSLDSEKGCLSEARRSGSNHKVPTQFRIIARKSLFAQREIVASACLEPPENHERGVLPARASHRSATTNSAK